MASVPFPDDGDRAARAYARLGPGAFEPLNWSVSVLVLRFVFLWEIVFQAPLVLSSLAGEPLATFLRVRQQRPRSDADTAELLDAVGAWQRQWGLTPPWLYELAVATLVEWCAPPSPHRAKPGEWTNVLLHPEMFDEAERVAEWAPSAGGLAGRAGLMSQSAELVGVDAVIRFSGWRLIRETRASARQRILAELAAAVDQYLDDVEREARSLGLCSPLTWTPEHVSWLVRYQVLGESFSAIARNVYRDRKSVRDAVTTTAARIELPLRSPNRPGRPRKASEA